MRHKRIANRYNLSLAVEAKRILVFETHPNDEIARLVWKPTADLLKILATEKPKFLRCFASPEFQPDVKNPDAFCFLHLVGPQNKVIYLGLVTNKSYAIGHWRELHERFKYNEEKREILERGGWKAISRDHMGCSIPVEQDTITRNATEGALRRYLEAFANDLASLPIIWLPDSDSRVLLQEIDRQARALATPMTAEERNRIIMRDSEHLNHQ